MKKLILTTTAILLVLAGLFSCEKEEPVALAGTNWYFAGIMDVETGGILELESPEDCHHCYRLKFYTDIIAWGRSNGGNIIQLHLSPKLMMGTVTMVDYEGIADAQLFYNAMEILTSYTVTEDELKLYYNERKNCLLFRKFVIVYY